MSYVNEWEHEWVRLSRTETAAPWQVAAETAARLIRALELRPGDHALELGCGRGLVSIELADRGVRMTAVDFSPTALELAASFGRERGQDVTWLCGDLRAPPPGPFKAVFVQGGIVAQLAAPNEFEAWLTTLGSIVEKGGRVLLELYTKEFAQIHGVESRLYYDDLLDRFTPRGASELEAARLFNGDELKRLIDECGMRLVAERFWSRQGDPIGTPHRNQSVLLTTL